MTTERITFATPSAVNEARDEAVASATTATTQAGIATDAATAAELSRDSVLQFEEDIGYQDLSEISKILDADPSDLFIYDTSLDSDGGAWRSRCQGLSWYNEPLNTATRGARRDHPAVTRALLVSNSLAIYDCDDPDVPMWKSIPLTGLTAKTVTARNGKYVVTTTTGLVVLDFVSDSLSITPKFSATTTPAIVNSSVNDAAMTVRPGAPVDPATGLPVPTIAVATAGGLSVIGHDGVVRNSGESGSILNCVLDDSGVWYSRFSALFYASHDDIASGSGFGDRVATSIGGGDNFDLLAGVKALDVLRDGSLAVGGNSVSNSVVPGVMIHEPNYTDQSKGMSALITSTYNTGWMVGDIKRAWLAESETTPLVGDNLVQDGGFDSGIVGWSVLNANATLSHTGSALRLETAATSTGATYILGGLIAGKRYTFSANIRCVTSNGAVRIAVLNPTESVFLADPNSDTSSTNFVRQSVEFTPTGESVRIYVRASVVGTYEADDVSVQAVSPDRSVNNKGLTVNGTITRTAVAAGSDTVWYTFDTATTHDLGTAPAAFYWWEQVAGAPVLYCRDVTNGLTYINGKLGGTIGTGMSLSGTVITFAAGKPMSRARVTNTAPTVEQITRIYRDELPLYRPGGKSLQGGSDDVRAASVDPITGLLHVGTPGGRTVFDGLSVVEHSTDPVLASISAVNNLVTEA